mgnify:CR=1 FL=1
MTEQAVTEETADRTESTESTDATELDETTEISDTAETEISEETETEKESGTTQILAGTYDAAIGGTYSGVCENQGLLPVLCYTAGSRKANDCDDGTDGEV